MKENRKNIFTLFKNKCLAILTDIFKSNVFSPKYRVLVIEQDAHEDYIAVVQIINSKNIFKVKPEEILADDDMTNSFSPCDVRTLTYLGYLGINSPKYKVLAKRLSETDKKIIFAIQEKGKRKPLIKTAEELSVDDEIISHLHQKDALLVGYTAGSESSIGEKEQMKELLKLKAEKLRNNR